MSYINFYSNGELRGYLLDKGLNIQQISLLQLLQELDNYAEQHGNATGIKISNARIRKELGISPTATNRYLTQLEKLNLIKLIYDRTTSDNTKRKIKPVKLIKFGIESQISGIIGYINKLLDSTLDNLYELDNADPETRSQVKQAILHFGSDKALIKYINSHQVEIENFDSVQDWLASF